MMNKYLLITIHEHVQSVVNYDHVHQHRKQSLIKVFTNDLFFKLKITTFLNNNNFHI